MLATLRNALGSLRWRLTLTYVALLALLVAALSTYQYVSLQHSLVTTRVQALTGDYDEVNGILQRLLPRAVRTQAELGRVLTLLCARLSGIAQPSQPSAAVADPERTYAQALVTASGRTATAVIYDRLLQPVAATPVDIADAPHMSDSALRTALDQRQSSGAETFDSSNGTQLGVAFPIGSRRIGGACGVAQLSVSTDQLDSVLSAERARLALGGGAVLLIALLAGLLLTSRELRPLTRLTSTARRLAGGDLRARANLPPRSGEIGELAHSFDDMAARIEALFAVQAESESRMRRFIGDASHELRTPITALKGYIDVLRRGAARDPGALDAALETMAREAERMRVLVLDLLTLARLDAQRQMELRPVDLGRVVSTVLDEGAPGMPEQLVRELDGTAHVVVSADSNAVATIARNLLVNACKYAPGAAQRWEVDVEDGHGVLRVHDDGPGIPAADLPHVFERFYRGEKTRAREEGGSGLGLSIVQGLAGAMGGDVAVESSEGRGATFTLRLPLSDAPVADGGTQPGETSSRT